MRLNIIRQRLRLIKSNSDFAERGRKMVKDSVVQLGPFPGVKYCLDWNQDPLNNRSWQWRWGSLSALAYLIAFHAESGDQRALEIGMELISNWKDMFISSDPTDTDLNEFVWHDHGTALRAEHILWFYCYAQDIEFTALVNDKELNILNLMHRHGEILARDTFYSEHTNHGLEQARVLMLLASSARSLWDEAPAWEAVALCRLSSELNFAYTEEGVHVENSPAYHIFVFKVFISIIQEFDKDELGELSTEFMSKAKLILDYITHVLRPDGLTPIIGDSEKLRPTDSFRALLGKTEEYRKFLYSFSGGKAGKKPTSTFKVCPISGYAIFRDRWENSDNFKNIVHLIFKGGALSQYHRQQDEGNIILYAYGEDWLIDSGMYNYNNSDPVRRYMRSRRAHNVAIVDGAKYVPWQSLKSSWNLRDDSSIHPDGSPKVVSFSFLGFESLSLLRRVAFSGESIRVMDRVRSLDGVSRKSRLIWHFDKSKIIQIVDSKCILIKSSISDICMKMTFDLDTEISVSSGLIGSRVASVVSEVANKFTESQIVEVILPISASIEVSTQIDFLTKNDT